jgi:hypothetical protein
VSKSEYQDDIVKLLNAKEGISVQKNASIDSGIRGVSLLHAPGRAN